MQKIVTDDKTNVVAKNKRTVLQLIINILFGIFLTLSVIVAIISCIFVITPVTGRSMQPTINAKWTEENKLEDNVLINRNDKGSRGDIIVAKKINEQDNVIKRLIAVGGDAISIAEDNVNGIKVYSIKVIYAGSSNIKIVETDSSIETIYEKFNVYLANRNNGRFKTQVISGNTYIILPQNYIFYLGDNHLHSDDCATYGPMSADNIIGKTELIIDSSANKYWESSKYLISKIFKWFFGQD